MQDYYQFVMGQYVPSLQSLRFQMSEASHTAYGDAPNRLIGFVCSDAQTVDTLLERTCGKNGRVSWRSTSPT